MDGFKRPSRPVQPKQKVISTQEAKSSATASRGVKTQQPISLPKPEEFAVESAPSQTGIKTRTRKTIILRAAGILVVVIATLLGVYGYLLSAVAPTSSEFVRVEIVSGMMPAQIAQTLEDSGVIRSSVAFTVHTKLRRMQNSLQAGNYVLSPADSTPEIASRLQNGPGVDEVEVMFTPGSTLADNKKVLLALGYDSDEIDDAFTGRYDHPLFKGRPVGSDIEGYIFGETHRFMKGTPVKDILKRYFDDYYAVLHHACNVSNRTRMHITRLLAFSPNANNLKIIAFYSSD